MAGFNQIEGFRPVQVPDGLRKGGVWWGKSLSVKPVPYRLRQEGEEDTMFDVGESDLLPIRLHTAKMTKSLRLPPDSREVGMGIEYELAVVDANTGEPFNVYGGDRIVKFEDDQITVTRGGREWLLDRAGGSPEAQNYVVEIPTPPGRTWDELEDSLLKGLGPLVDACEVEGALLLPLGMVGTRLPDGWGNISPHPLIARIMKYNLNGQSLDFDAASIQCHTDLMPFGGSAEFGLYVGNVYNTLPATLVNAIATAAPFWKGQLTGRVSNRELSRWEMYTRGGVQANIPVDAIAHLRRGDLLMRENLIPLPERAGGRNDDKDEAVLRAKRRMGLSIQESRPNGSHKDTRTKYRTGTFETGPGDGNHFELALALAVIQREFVLRVAKHVISDEEPLPAFLQPLSMDKRVENRVQAITYGDQAVLKLNRGEVTVAEGWEHLIEWTSPDERSADWERAVDVVSRLLTPANLPGEYGLGGFFDNRNGTYLKGNLGRAALNYAYTVPGSGEEKIRETNKEAGRVFMDDLKLRLGVRR